LSGKPPRSFQRHIGGKQLARVPKYACLMVSRIVGAFLIMLATYLAYMGIGIAVTMTELFLGSGGGWLGPEPEMLIPIAALLVAGLMCWLGARLWGRKQHQH
jgi:hypothetical protein